MRLTRAAVSASADHRRSERSCGGAQPPDRPRSPAEGAAQDGPDAQDPYDAADGSAGGSAAGSAAGEHSRAYDGPGRTAGGPGGTRGGRDPDTAAQPPAGPAAPPRPGPRTAGAVEPPEGGPAGEAVDAVDADVAGAVLRTARTVLREHLAEASAVDAVFARDVARRVADFTLGGGKRARPRFLWWAMRACGGGTDTVGAALRLGVALELIQTCALVHDDVMDGSPLRRGRPAVHVELADVPGGPPDTAFGTSAAVLVGDLALAWADDTVAAVTAVPMNPATRHRVLDIWRAMRTEMVAGQYLDLHGQAAATRTAAHALRTACLKSALYSVERPLALGAALAGADERTTAALCAAGRSAGTAFQLRDDLLGAFGDPAVTGKPSGGDLRDGKPTYLVAVARERAEAAGDTAVLAVLDADVGDPGLTDEGLARVRDALTRSGARAAVEHRADRLAADAEARLDLVGLHPEGARRLRLLLREAAGGPTLSSSPPPPPPSPLGSPPPVARPATDPGPGSQGESTR
ncbi:polyprenyl synthetase family protein [Streptomyces sp. NBC_00102]|uniref:polyprenyl synthetase family protein n=1 Tax=Streptomyces sp. NBC_00102 TaxID=2975652 RepID=UPI00224ECA3D|nr:polyprenyl synthetase family protein [Streptomyces sp. NBC_00102]MCX5401255.1 polyprenyl synthetase family protein [Streptomyces sp. NBC_00102]